MGGDNHVFRKNGRGIFFAEGLDTFLIKRSDLPVGLNRRISAARSRALAFPRGSRFAAMPQDRTLQGN